jgi:hypothetical protein
MLGGHPASSRSRDAPIAINLCELKIGIFNRIYSVGLWQRAPTAGTRVRLNGTVLDRYDPRRTLGDEILSSWHRWRVRASHFFRLIDTEAHCGCHDSGSAKAGDRDAGDQAGAT